jgi:hypothetical protein
VTLCVTEDPPQFLKFTVGRETLCNDSTAAATDAERLIYEWCERVVEKRVRGLQRLIAAAQT